VLPPASDDRTATRVDCTAGASPNRNSVAAPAPASTSSTWPSMGVLMTIGSGDAGSTMALIAFLAQFSTTAPTSTAPAASSALSVMS
jgi:hypothetical protein